MRKCLILLVSVVVCMGLLAGCCLFHDWQAATCEEPKTCSACQKTEGEPLGHSFSGGTCEQPPVCQVCGAQGEPAGHNWQDATYTQPMKCSVCGATQGEALPRYDETQFFITPEDFIQLYGEILAPQGYSLITEETGQGMDVDWPPMLYVVDDQGEMTGAMAIMRKDPNTGMLTSVEVAFEVWNSADIELYDELGGVIMMAMETLLGVPEEEYAKEFSENLEIVGFDQEMFSITMVSEIRGLSFMLESFENGAMITLTPANAP